MKKKFLAMTLTAAMVIGSVFSAFAEDVDCTGWWAAHSTGYEIDADGLELTFHTQTYDTATANWNTPIYVVYTGNEPKVNGDGYVEAFVMRSDNYGWSGANNTGAGLEGLLAAGFTVHETIGVPADDAAWAAWLDGNKKGVDCTLKATKGEGNVTVEYTNNGLTSKVTIPVDTSKEVYVSLSGEFCKITDLKEVVKTTEEDTTEKDTEATTEETTTEKDTEATTEETTTEKDTEATTEETTTAKDADVSEEIKVSVSGDNVPAGAAIAANKVEDKTVLEKVEKAVKDKLDKVIGKYAVLDITMSVNGTKVQPLNNGNVLVTIDVPTGIDATKSLVVYRVEDNGGMTELKTTVKDGKVSFETSHFSTYVVAEKAVAATEETTTKKADTPKTGDAAPIAVLMVVALGACGAVVLSKRKNA